MVEVLEFIFQDIWHFAGTAILLICIVPHIYIKKD